MNEKIKDKMITLKLKFDKERKRLQMLNYGGYYAAVTENVLKVFITENDALNFAETVPNGECFVAPIGEDFVDLF